MYFLDRGSKYKKLLIDKSYKHTNGYEFCENKLDKKLLRITYAEIYYCKCDYCGREILAVWDGYNQDNYWPYLGNQSKRITSYEYSPIINILKKFYQKNNMDWKENNLLNSHTRVHSDSFNLSIRMNENALRFLCNECFQETYNRIQVKGNNGITYALSVVKSRGETIESVMNDLNIKGEILGKGAISEY